MGHLRYILPSSKLFTMASLFVTSSVAKCAAATLSRTATRALSTTTAVNADKKLTETIDHATGPEKLELLAKQQGNDNLFDTYMVKPEPMQGFSAKTAIPIPSAYDSRIVDCSCEHAFKEVIWFKLERSKGVQQCECGMHFKLVKHDPLDRSVRPKYGKGYGSGMVTFYS